MLSTIVRVKEEDDSSSKEEVKSDPSESNMSNASDSVSDVTKVTEDSTVTVSKDEKTHAIKEEEETKQDEIESESDSSSDERDNSEAKSIGNNDWDNSYSNQLKQMYSNVDPDTRAAAEEMIKAINAGTKNSSNDGKAKTSSPTPNDTADSSSSATTAKPGKSDSKSDKSATSSKSAINSNTVINKGKEPCALEMALKQQGITQSDQLRSTQFPFRLHNMLDDAERSDHAHIVSWCSGGESFKIHEPTKLISVLQKYFRQSKFKSFLRQLQGYNFKRITRGKDQGVVSHPLFLRGRRSVSTLMRRKRVGTKTGEGEQLSANKNTTVANGNITFGKTASLSHDGIAARAPNPPANAGIIPQRQQSMTRPPPTVIQPAQNFLNNLHKVSSQSPKSIGVINPNPQDVLCVEYPNAQTAQQFQGNRKLASIVQKITGHYTSTNESVRSMIVNEISSRIQNSGSRFLKLSKGGRGWIECNREEMFAKVISSFEQEIGAAAKEKTHIDLTGERGSPALGSVGISKTLPAGMGNAALHGIVASSDQARRPPPRNQDVVLRGGPGSEREGNTYLKTTIQANVGSQLDSFEMKRIKCRAILERMKRRGSRFFLKLKETDSDDEMYILSDGEAQDVIYTAFCAEEKKIQSFLVEAPSASSILRAKALAGLEAIPGLGLGGAPQFASRQAALQNDAALLNQLKANNEISLRASQGSLKRPLPGHAHLTHDIIIEKRLRAETDEHIKLLIERERQRRTDPYGANALAGRIPFNARSAAVEQSHQLSSAFGGGAAAAAPTSIAIEQYLKERRADEMLLKSAAAARAPFANGPSPVGLGAGLGAGLGFGAGLGAGLGIGLGAELPKSNSNFVEFLKKKYVKSAQERAW